MMNLTAFRDFAWWSVTYEKCDQISPKWLKLKTSHYIRMTILFFPAISAALTVLHSTKCPHTLSISYYGLVQRKSVESLCACAWRAGFCSAKYFNVLFFSVTKAQPQLKLAWSQLRSQCGGLSFNLAAGCICEEILGSKTEGSSTASRHQTSFICPFAAFHTS